MINHIGTNSIETIRLILRRFKEEDTYDMHKNWASDKESLKFLSWGPYSDMGVTKGRIGTWIRQYDDKKVYNWAIYLKSIKEVIGQISVEISSDKEKSCEIGYCIGKEFWGREIVLEALRAVMHYLSSEVGYEKIIARHDVQNTASGRVMQKAGMKFQKRLLNVGHRRDGSLYDVDVYVKYYKEVK
ncbi:MAG: GNAT family N-acetyltransferase [Clostridiales bacterium]|nr:GNAT family N-acetyltransferase [Clostridiales bacterium]